MRRSEMVYLTQDEYYEWLKASAWISQGEMFTSCCGPHEFSDIVRRDGNLYALYNGFYPEKDEDPNAKYAYKTVYWWGVKLLQRDDGQEGDGI